MPGHESNPSRSAAFTACAAAGLTAALCELARALSGPESLAPSYAAWCVFLIVAASCLVGVIGLIARGPASLTLVVWLAVAAAVVHGWRGSIAFAIAGLILGALARNARPALLTSAVGAGALFEVCGSHANHLTGLTAAGLIPPDRAELVQHVAAFTLCGIGLTWIFGLRVARAKPGLSAVALLVLSLAFCSRGFLESPKHAKPVSRGRTETAAVPDAGPSVLILVLDTVRADHTSLYGYARRTTPQLERVLAAQPGAVRFEHAYANGSWTVPSHGALLSGQLPSVHGADFAGRREEDPIEVAIYPSVPMLAELLHGRGWSTFAVFANRWLRTAPGFRRGFDEFERIEPSERVKPLGEALREQFVPGLCAGETTTYPSAKAVSARLLEHLDGLGSARFFALANFMDAHGPHMPMPDVAGTFGPWSIFDENEELLLHNPPATNQRLMDRYDEQILHLDLELGRLFDELARRKILEHTWVFVLGDHGEAFAEHGVTDHGTAVYNEIVHVPLLVFPPRGAALDPTPGPASQVDVAATIAAIAGVDYHGPGRDLRVRREDAIVQIQHGAAPFRVSRDGAIAGLDMRAVLRGNWKLVDIGGTLQLFDLAADPGETHDLAKERPELVAELGALLPERMLHAAPVPGRSSVTPEDASGLKHLGY